MEHSSFHAPVNNYHGLSQEDIEREVELRTAALEKEVIRLQGEVVNLKTQLAKAESDKDRLLGMLGERLSGTAQEGRTRPSKGSKNQ